MNRGVERRSIYKDSSDNLKFLDLLQEAITKYSWRLYAYVLMGNHYHLLFETPGMTLSRGMKDLDGDYVEAFNFRHSRVGHLFQGRFKAQLVDSENYLLEVCRYIVLNPVRAGFVKDPGDWIWSSYAATVGLAPAPSWLDVNAVLERFDHYDRETARSYYREFVASCIGSKASPWDDLVSGVFLGDEKFLRKVEEKVRERKWSHEHPRNQREYRVASLDDLQSTLMSVCALKIWPPAPSGMTRSLFATLAVMHTNATNAAIGRALGISGQATGRLIVQGRERIADDHLFKELASTVSREMFRVST